MKFGFVNFGMVNLGFVNLGFVNFGSVNFGFVNFELFKFPIEYSIIFRYIFNVVFENPILFLPTTDKPDFVFPDCFT